MKLSPRALNNWDLKLFKEKAQTIAQIYYTMRIYLFPLCFELFFAVHCDSVLRTSTSFFAQDAHKRFVPLCIGDDGSIIRIFVQINILEGRAGYVLMDPVLVTISYSYPCLTTETVKYINENCFIENLAASKNSMWAQRGKQMQ